jgi:hypothetical protein
MSSVKSMSCGQHDGTRGTCFDQQASGSELAALKQRALAAEQEAAALQQGKLEAEAASAAARKAQKVSAVHVPSCSSFRIEQHL